MSLALARKYRPQTFLEVIGQDAIIQTINNAITKDHLHHAYLFCGVRGVGKTSMARILAKSINCLEGGPTITPCQTCSSCQSITDGRSLDVIEIDGASHNLVDDVRELREQVKYLPSESRYKIIIIDEVHMLSNSAFNALLKTLEEPPAHVIFIFATTESHKIPVTILSRCQKYDFRKVSPTILSGHLKSIAEKENIDIEETAIHLIAQCAQGSVRDSLSLLDQIRSIQTETIKEDNVRQLLGLSDRLFLRDAFKSLVTEDLNKSLEILNEVDQRGLDLKLFAEDLLQLYRHLTLIEATKSNPSELGPSDIEFFDTIKGHCDVSLLLAQYQILFQSIQELTHSSFQKTVLEITFVKLNQARQMIGLADLVKQIKTRQAGVAQKQRTAAPRAHPQQRQTQPTSPRPELTNNAPATDWYSLVKWITKEKPPIGTLLKDAVPISFGETQIEVGFAPESQTKGIVIDRVSTIEKLIESHFGKKVPFKIQDLSDEKKKP